MLKFALRRRRSLSSKLKMQRKRARKETDRSCTLVDAPIKQEIEERFLDLLVPLEDNTLLDSMIEPFRWSQESARLMLKLRFERQADFQQRIRQKKELWNEISNEMEQQGHFEVAGDACYLKYRNMLQTYKKNWHKEENGNRSIAWEYYDIFKQAFKDGCGAEDLSASLLCESTYDIDGAHEETETGRDTKRNLNRDLVGGGKLFEPNEEEKPQCNRKTRSSGAVSEGKWPRISSACSASEPEPRSISVEKQISTASNTPPTPILLQRTTTSTQCQTQSCPQGLEATELKECQVFGESVGIQLAHVKSDHTRALLQLKIQELLYMAKIGKLTEKS